MADEKYCCEMMTVSMTFSCPTHGRDCVDVVMGRLMDGSFGIPVHDGGSSLIIINYCPWCGADIKPRRSEMFEEEKGLFRKAARAELYTELTEMFKNNALEGLRERFEAMRPLDAASAALYVYLRLWDPTNAIDDVSGDTHAARFHSWLGSISREK